MIRIEGIPVVAARLAAAQKAKSTHARSKSRRTSTIGVGDKATVAVHSAPQIKMKVA